MLKRICKSLAMDYIAAAVMTFVVFWPLTLFLVDFLFYAFTNETWSGFNWAMYVLLLVYIVLSSKLLDPLVKRYLAWIRSP